MLKSIKRYKIVLIFVLSDLFLFWLLFYSGIVLPFINPSVEEYKNNLARGTSFPRNSNQMLLWIIIHMPTSLIIGSILKWSDAFLSLSVIQTGLIVFIIDKFVMRIRGSKRK